MQGLTRLTSILALIVLGLLLVVSPVLAIDPPDALQINSVYAYQHCLENNDQLYIVEYTITYTPTNPDENATEAYLGRLMDGATELKATAPYAFFDEGYGTGVFAIYFPATDPDLPTWASALTMRLEGNPTLDWGGVPPNTAVSTFDVWSSSTSIATTQAELASRILYLADKLEQAWGINMIDSTGTGSYLSDYGASYFSNVIPNLRGMAPKALAGGTTAIEWEVKTPSTTYADDRAVSVDDTLLDVQKVADKWGVSRMWMSTLLYMIGAVLVLYALVKPTGSSRGLTLLSAPIVIAGGYLGMIPLLATVLLGVTAFALSLFVLFYHPSGA